MPKSNINNNALNNICPIKNLTKKTQRDKILVKEKRVQKKKKSLIP